MHDTRVLTTDGLLGWPDEWLTRHFNASHDPCDMLIGPCACGAWHKATDWDDVLAHYNAEIRIVPKDQHNEIEQKRACTLGSF